MTREDVARPADTCSSTDAYTPHGVFLCPGRVTVTGVRVRTRGGLSLDLDDLTVEVVTVAPATRILDFLRAGRGARIVSAMHHDQPYRDPQHCDVLHLRVADETGTYPALYSADFLTGETVPWRGNMVDEVVRQWGNGCLVQIMFHVSPPQYRVDEEAAGGWGTDAAEETLRAPNRVYSYLTEQRWHDLFTPGSWLHENWVERLDEYGRHLARLKQAGVTVLLRPFHEMNQHVFWWGGRPGATGTAALFRWMRRHFEERFGLDNVIWVWNVQDLPDDYGHVDGDEKFARYRGLDGGLAPYDADDWDAFNPGADAYDILSVDFYDDEGFSPRRYAQAKRIAERDGKPFIIGETFRLPHPEVLRDQPDWALAMPWGIRTWRYNTEEEMVDFYRHSIGAADLPRFVA